jgi:DNA mismatch endonuclease, patch repair protein
MADHLTAEKRSWNMGRIRSTNTAPEKRVRSLLHRLGYRYSLKRKDLPGKPDITLVRHKTAILVHGCFWHQHKQCKRSNTPKTNKSYWISKIEGNIKRDKRNYAKLRKIGWRVITLWECQTKKNDELKARMTIKLKGLST